ncbi:MAG: DUF4129 domain-containing protein [Verrucomicrobia bacterium]|nr:DUF4129 domain-containing protein [Verrucomicrobiota bacterium]MBI3868103.1 DUF4129 domain-containing protein [Verrucomicrobiota bacterium]
MLLGFAILVWGWSTGLLMAAAPLAVVLESACRMRRRWEFTHADYQKIWNGCLILLLASVVFAVGYSRSLLDAGANNEVGPEAREAATQAAKSALLFFQWLPLVFAPVAVSVALGGHWILPATVFSWIARRHRAASHPRHIDRFAVHVAPLSAYLALVLFAASTSNIRHSAFFALMVLMAAWALWPYRSRRARAWSWLSVLLLAGGLGFAGQLGIIQIQRIISNLDNFVTQRLSRSHTNPFESRTMIGSVGRLKGSGRIVLRLTTTNDAPVELLRQASYDSFVFSTWVVGSRSDRGRTNLAWRTIIDENLPGSWRLVRAPRPEIGAIRLTHFTQGAATLLPLPNGSVNLEELRVGQLSRSGFGCVRAGDVPNLLDYQVSYCSGSSLDDPPTDRDRAIPAEERAAVNEIAAQLRLLSHRAEADNVALAVLGDFFVRNFKYSTYLEGVSDAAAKRSPVSDFLLRHRSGHCEYFATATCLLLRAAGIPTRYALGYSVSERAGRNNYIVRDRHAHAWCLVWSDQDKCWHDFDTTPPSWLEVESGRSSAWEPIGDMGSRVWLEYARWREGRSELSRYAIYFLSGVLVLFFLRLFLKTRRQTRLAEGLGGRSPFQPLGMNSEYYQVERTLARAGLARRPDETQRRWVERILSAAGDRGPDLMELVEFHYRLRFDPSGLPAEDRAKLRERAADYVAWWSGAQRQSLSRVTPTAAKS